jgi:YD repeat-containing protein
VPGDSNTAVTFDGVNDSARANLNLSGTSVVSVEFWLKWNRYADDDALAMEFTDNFNGSDGGFLIDPDAPQLGGTFGVGLGRFASRNNVFFPRPTAGVWHHYTFVFDTTAPGATQITPYVDGAPVSYTKLDSGTGGGPFASAALNFMSRGGTSLFGGGTLDEVAVYNRALSAATVAEHYASSGTNRRPIAALTLSQTSVKVNKNVTFRATGSSDPDGSIVKYQWDTDGNGSFETDTGATNSVTRSYTTTGDRVISLRVMDNRGGTDVDSKTLFVGNDAPTASFTISPNPAIIGQTVTFNGSASSDLDGTVVKYEWDLDGNGTFETNTGTTATTSRVYANAATVNIGLRVTDDDGATGTTTRAFSVKSASYQNAVLATPGLKDYWRMEELSGPTFADSKGSSPATASGGVAFGSPGALPGAGNAAGRFDGITGSAAANIDLSASTAVTVEFWLKWDVYADNDALAMEFTSNFNQNDGGFLVDPNSADGTFAVSMGRDTSRNSITFTRPSPNQWHHYVFVLDTTAPAATQITPYVDGQPVAYAKTQSGAGAPAFANSTLFFMSRGGASLFGAGALDEVAIYDGALSAATVAEHYADGTP